MVAIFFPYKSTLIIIIYPRSLAVRYLHQALHFLRARRFYRSKDTLLLSPSLRNASVRGYSCLRPSGVLEQHSADMVKNIVKQAVSNPAIHSKLAINVRKKLYWSKDGRKSSQHGVGMGRPAFFNQTPGLWHA